MFVGNYGEEVDRFPLRSWNLIGDVMRKSREVMVI